jgi:hypothetical protein
VRATVESSTAGPLARQAAEPALGHESAIGDGCKYRAKGSSRGGVLG